MGISTDGIPDDVSQSIDILFRDSVTMEPDCGQDTAEIDVFWVDTDHQVIAMASMQTNIEKLELSSLNQLSVVIAVLQKKLDVPQ